MVDEFDEVLIGTESENRSWHKALACAKHPMPELVSEVYRRSPALLRTKLLECLLRPVGPLALVALSTGAFSHLLHRLTRD
ncbi:MAG TPA: hypothetical protein VEE84_01370, partial [Burkholderiaceae bacterium]|nr:hypothetical protein [Burkholderiaceae bacterium]